MDAEGKVSWEKKLTTELASPPVVSHGLVIARTMDTRVSAFEASSGLLGEELMDADEKLFQQMWKTYFKSIAIKERLNPKLHRQHMPARFWKYMPEKL